jgi:hypothetical protein
MYPEIWWLGGAVLYSVIALIISMLIFKDSLEAFFAVILWPITLVTLGIVWLIGFIPSRGKKPEKGKP